MSRMPKYLLVCLVFFVFVSQCTSSTHNSATNSNTLSNVNEASNSPTSVEDEPEQCSCNDIVLDLTTDENVKLGEVTLSFHGDLFVTVETTQATDILERAFILLTTSVRANANINVLNEYQIELEAISENTLTGKVPINSCGINLYVAVEADILLNGSVQVSATTATLNQEISAYLDSLAELYLCCDCVLDEVTENVNSFIPVGLFGQVYSVTDAPKMKGQAQNIIPQSTNANGDTMWVVFGVSAALIALVGVFVAVFAIVKKKKQQPSLELHEEEI